jgi:putative ABC transport system ATP-binding protein
VRRAVIELRAVRKVHQRSGRAVTALDGVTLEFARGEFVAVVGPSGSGKSTLLHLIAGLDSPTAGSVLIGGRDLAELPDGELARLRREEIGIVFQFFNLVPTLDVAENVALPLFLGGASRRDVEPRVAELLERVGLRDRADAFPPELSGGEMQRVAIARALCPRPAILLADEPTGNLDSASGRAILELVAGAWRDERPTVVLVTHDREAAAIAGRSVHLRDGRIAEP